MARVRRRSCCCLGNGYVLAAIGLAACSIFFAVELPESDVHPSRIEVIPIPGGATGPESLAFDADGEGPYTGVSDGRILKWQGKELGWLEYAVTSPMQLSKQCRRSAGIAEREQLCGRPLGMQFNKKTGELYIADATQGLLMVSPGEKFAKRIVKQVEGEPLQFTNGLDIDQNSGLVYFSDSSRRFRRSEFMSTVISGDRTGRVVTFNPENKQVQVLLDDLHYPNGLALSPDGSFLLIAETTTCRILRHWLHPSNKGIEIFARLPGFPDNIRPSPRGGFWVALYSRRGKFIQWLLSFPHFLKEMFLWLPIDVHKIFTLLGKGLGRPLVVRVSEEGEVLEVLEDFGGKMVRFVSEIEERNGTLWIGSVVMPHVSVYEL